MTPARTLPLLLLLCMASSACTWFKTNQGVLISSDPAGASIFIDGHDSGETTPHVFDMAGNFGSDHRIELRRKGYRPEQRQLLQFTEAYMFRYVDGAAPVELPPLPIYMGAGDVVFPFGVRGSVIPSEIFVKLYREDEPLLGFDLLAARRAEAAKAAQDTESADQ